MSDQITMDTQKLSSIPSQLTIFISTKIPNYTRFVYNKIVYFNPLIPFEKITKKEDPFLNEETFKKYLENIKPKDKSILELAKTNESLALLKATQKGYVEKNILVILNTLFARNNQIELGNYPFTIEKFIWDNSWTLNLILKNKDDANNSQLYILYSFPREVRTSNNSLFIQYLTDLYLLKGNIDTNITNDDLVLNSLEMNPENLFKNIIGNNKIPANLKKLVQEFQNNTLIYIPGTYFNFTEDPICLILFYTEKQFHDTKDKYLNIPNLIKNNPYLLELFNIFKEKRILYTNSIVQFWKTWKVLANIQYDAEELYNEMYKSLKNNASINKYFDKSEKLQKEFYQQYILYYQSYLNILSTQEYFFKSVVDFLKNLESFYSKNIFSFFSGTTNINVENEHLIIKNNILMYETLLNLPYYKEEKTKNEKIYIALIKNLTKMIHQTNPVDYKATSYKQNPFLLKLIIIQNYIDNLNILNLYQKNETIKFIFFDYYSRSLLNNCLDITPPSFSSEKSIVSKIQSDLSSNILFKSITEFTKDVKEKMPKTIDPFSKLLNKKTSIINNLRDSFQNNYKLYIKFLIENKGIPNILDLLKTKETSASNQMSIIKNKIIFLKNNNILTFSIYILVIYIFVIICFHRLALINSTYNLTLIQSQYNTFCYLYFKVLQQSKKSISNKLFTIPYSNTFNISNTDVYLNTELINNFYSFILNNNRLSVFKNIYDHLKTDNILLLNFIYPKFDYLSKSIKNSCIKTSFLISNNDSQCNTYPNYLDINSKENEIIPESNFNLSMKGGTMVNDILSVTELNSNINSFSSTKEIVSPSFDYEETFNFQYYLSNTIIDGGKFYNFIPKKNKYTDIHNWIVNKYDSIANLWKSNQNNLVDSNNIPIPLPSESKMVQEIQILFTTCKNNYLDPLYLLNTYNSGTLDVLQNTIYNQNFSLKQIFVNDIFIFSNYFTNIVNKKMYNSLLFTKNLESINRIIIPLFDTKIGIKPQIYLIDSDIDNYSISLEEKNKFTCISYLCSLFFNNIDILKEKYIFFLLNNYLVKTKNSNIDSMNITQNTIQYIAQKFQLINDSKPTNISFSNIISGNVELKNFYQNISSNVKNNNFQFYQEMIDYIYVNNFIINNKKELEYGLAILTSLISNVYRSIFIDSIDNINNFKNITSFDINDPSLKKIVNDPLNQIQYLNEVVQKCNIYIIEKQESNYLIGQEISKDNKLYILFNQINENENVLFKTKQYQIIESSNVHNNKLNIITLNNISGYEVYNSNPNNKFRYKIKNQWNQKVNNNPIYFIYDNKPNISFISNLNNITNNLSSNQDYINYFLMYDLYLFNDRNNLYYNLYAKNYINYFNIFPFCNYDILSNSNLSLLPFYFNQTVLNYLSIISKNNYLLQNFDCIPYIYTLKQLTKQFKINNLPFIFNVIIQYLKINKIPIVDLIFFQSFFDLNLSKYYNEIKAVEESILKKCKDKLATQLKTEVKNKVIKNVEETTMVFINYYGASNRDIRTTYQIDKDALVFQHLIMNLMQGEHNLYSQRQWLGLNNEISQFKDYIGRMAKSRLYVIDVNSSTASYKGGAPNEKSLYQPSFLSYYIYITLDLYPGKVDINTVKKQLLDCKNTRENIKQSIANIRHIPYEPPSQSIEELKSLDPNYSSKLKPIETKGGQISDPFETIYLH